MRVLAVVPDLFFAARIAATAEAVGAEVEIVEPARALERCRAWLPDRVILDLHAPGDPLDVARARAAEPATRAIPVIGFYAHVDTALRDAALAAGVQAMPRSAFTARLAALLGKE
jgi:CheY-like chemotaxis protein